MPTFGVTGASLCNLNPEARIEDEGANREGLDLPILNDASKEDEGANREGLDLSILNVNHNPSGANQIDLNAEENSDRNEKVEPLTSVVSKTSSSSCTPGNAQKLNLSKASKAHLKERLKQVKKEKMQDKVIDREVRIYRVHFVNTRPSKKLRKAMDLIITGDSKAKVIGARIIDEVLYIQGNKDYQEATLNIEPESEHLRFHELADYEDSG